MTSAIRSNRIADGLNRNAGKIAIDIVDETGSTSTDLLQRVHTLSSPALLLARRQTAGRGRNGKTWHSEENSSLTFSLAWPFSRPEAELAGLSLAVGVSIAQTLRELGVLVMLKWPNDILRDGKKLAGILVERPSDHFRKKTDKNWVIIGIGINLQLPDELEAQIRQPVAEARWLSGMDKNLLMTAFLNHLADAFVLFEKEGLAPFIPSWNNLHAYDGRQVTVFQHAREEQTGTVMGIDGYGRLILENNGHRMSFSTGDVSLRPFDG
ncbi:biotin--[acetyl-CoA-carboxylase] ligase [Oxalobacter sp. OttesenSCG-928-P03]|nr:biotin--[acetyl-CoA-carboxylase] ligase [Oxalobacter sp. OttesenSCG-928-P03]